MELLTDPNKKGIIIFWSFWYVNEYEALNREGAIIDLLQPTNGPKLLWNEKAGEFPGVNGIYEDDDVDKSVIKDGKELYGALSLLHAYADLCESDVPIIKNLAEAQTIIDSKEKLYSNKPSILTFLGMQTPLRLLTNYPPIINSQKALSYSTIFDKKKGIFNIIWK